MVPAANSAAASRSVRRIFSRASLYRIDLTDEIGYNGSSNTNLDLTRRQGGELEADWKLSDAWQAKASYAYTDATFRSGASSGKDVPPACAPSGQRSTDLEHGA